MNLAEYIWLDGALPTQQLRSKARILKLGSAPKIEDFPDWGFDGSSTNQADGGDSDLVLRPVRYVSDPLRGEGNFLVMCEVLQPDETPHPTNQRASLRAVLEEGAAAEEPWFGFEQEYTLFDVETNWVLGWPTNGYPRPQGPYYCGIGAENAFGRDLVEAHYRACLYAGIKVSGVNAEVMAGQWEYQVGPCEGIEAGDQLWMSRYDRSRSGENNHKDR